MKLNLSPLTLLFFALYLLTTHDLTLIFTVTAIVIHELTHLIVLYLCNGHATKLTVSPLGLSIERTGSLSYNQEAMLALSAPLVNLILAGVFYINRLSPYAVSANLSFGLFNLLPIFPLDGAKEHADCFGRVLSAVFLFGLWLFSIALALFGDNNLSLLLLSAALFFANLSSGRSDK